MPHTMRQLEIVGDDELNAWARCREIVIERRTLRKRDMVLLEEMKSLHRICVKQLIEDYKFTKREKQVLDLLHSDHEISNKEIGNIIHCSERTVKLFVTGLLRKTGVCSRAKLLEMT